LKNSNENNKSKKKKEIVGKEILKIPGEGRQKKGGAPIPEEKWEKGPEKKGYALLGSSTLPEGKSPKVRPEKKSRKGRKGGQKKKKKREDSSEKPR